MLGQQILIVIAIVLLFVPRRYAVLVFLFGALLIPRGACFLVGTLSIFPSRFLVFVGLIRMVIKSEYPLSIPVREDWWVLTFSIICFATSYFHVDPKEAFIFSGSLVIDSAGTYLLCRTWIKSWEDIITLIKGSSLLLLILAITMTYEKITDHNLFAYLGHLHEYSAIRDGKIRAAGPFSHSILGGTMGAIYLPWVAAIWRDNKRIAIAMLVCIVMIVYASTSSGPILTFLAGMFALFLWKYRANIRLIKRGIICMLIMLDLVMKDRVWFLLARIDLTGSSTGWHRAKLISSAIEHINEWWLAGTDFTRHWMPTGVSWSPDHSDITNYYIKMGVIGGLPLMISFIMILKYSFKHIGQTYNKLGSHIPGRVEYQLWCLGSTLFAHCVTLIGVGYFDQSIVSLYSLVGIIAAGCICLQKEKTTTEASS